MTNFQNVDLGNPAMRLARLQADRFAQTLPQSSRRPPSMERMVRPFVLVNSGPRPVEPQRPELPGADDPAYIEWGAASNFFSYNLDDPITSDENLGTGGFRVEWPKDKEEKDEKDRVYNEIERNTKKIRVENPNDSEQYVMVERIEWIRFSDPKGGVVRFVMKNR